MTALGDDSDQKTIVEPLRWRLSKWQHSRSECALQRQLRRGYVPLESARMALVEHPARFGGRLSAERTKNHVLDNSRFSWPLRRIGHYQLNYSHGVRSH